MPIIPEMSIHAFRGILDLELKNLSTINVLVGGNNSGKTSVLEAIKLISSPYNLATMIQLAKLRRASTSTQVNTVENVSTLFRKELEDTGEPHFDLGISAIIDGDQYSYECSGNIDNIVSSRGNSSRAFLFYEKIKRNGEQSEYLKQELTNKQDTNYAMTKSPIVKALYFHSGVVYYRACVYYLSESIINERKKEIIDLLKSFDSSIEDISIIGEDVYLHNNLSGTMPLFTYGTGLQKATLLAAILSNLSNGVVLVDEIDNAMNISAFREVFPWFINVCRERNIQAFVTTHSAEAIDAILECYTDDLNDDIRVITLRKTSVSHKTIAKVRTGTEARSDREHFEMELRV